MKRTHRDDIKEGHRTFARVLSDDEDEDEGGSGSNIQPDGLVAPFANGGLPHPWLANSAYFSGVEKTKLSARATDNANVQAEQFPEPNLQPSLTHTPRAAPSRTPTPQLMRR